MSRYDRARRGPTRVIFDTTGDILQYQAVFGEKWRYYPGPEATWEDLARFERDPQHWGGVGKTGQDLAIAWRDLAGFDTPPEVARGGKTW